MGKTYIFATYKKIGMPPSICHFEIKKEGTLWACKQAADRRRHDDWEIYEVFNPLKMLAYGGPPGVAHSGKSNACMSGRLNPDHPNGLWPIPLPAEQFRHYSWIDEKVKEQPEDAHFTSMLAAAMERWRFKQVKKATK